MNSSGHAFLQPATLTKLSGLATIIVATLALGSMAKDQSGQSAAMVSKSFRAELGASHDAFGVISFATLSSRGKPKAIRQLPNIADRPFADVKANVDPAQDFANLQSELARIGGACTALPAMQEIRIDILVDDAALIDSLMNRTSDLLADAELKFDRNTIRIEIQTWAASPTQSGWIAATREALRLRNEIKMELSATESHELQISSSAALWPHPDQLRPAATIALRIPLPSSTY
ncbi:MAG: hypothetical protein O2856_15765 [Planctomycetota bacterium]|nr:hypothetical protein [Planctomycetota bacterium]